MSILILAVGLIANAASAGPEPSIKQTDGGPCVYETIDACFHEGDWWYEGTSIDGGFRYTTLSCGLTDGCKACGLTAQGKPVCVNILYDAACKCKLEQVPDAGPNIVSCSDEGACEVR